jgi:hypothetical protein
VSLTAVSVPGGIAPSNPESGVVTPDEFNRGYSIEYRLSMNTEANIQKVLLMVPGFPSSL